MGDMTFAGFNHVSFAAMPLPALLGLAVAVLAPAIALAQGTPEQRAACQPDAMRLCSEFVPDVDAITACMTRKRLRLSPACRVYFVAPRKGKSFRRTE
jgi:hypothetical protein